MSEEQLIGVISVGSYEGLLSSWRITRTTANGNDEYAAKISFRTSPHDGSIRSLKSSGKILASGGYDGSVALFDIVNNKKVGSLIQHEDSVDDIDFYENSYIATGSADKTICLWRTKDWALVKQFKGHTASVNSLAIASCGKFMLSVGRDAAVRMWDLMRAHNARTRKLPMIPSIIRFANTDEKFIIVVGRSAIVINGITENTEAEYKTESNIMTICVDGDDLWIGCVDGTIYGYNLLDNKFYGVYNITDKRIKYMKAEGGYITVLTAEGNVIFGNIDENKDINTILTWKVDTRITCGDFAIFKN